MLLRFFECFFWSERELGRFGVAEWGQRWYALMFIFGGFLAFFGYVARCSVDII